MGNGLSAKTAVTRELSRNVQWNTGAGRENVNLALSEAQLLPTPFQQVELDNEENTTHSVNSLTRNL